MLQFRRIRRLPQKRWLCFNLNRKDSKKEYGLSVGKMHKGASLGSFSVQPSHETGCFLLGIVLERAHLMSPSVRVPMHFWSTVLAVAAAAAIGILAAFFIAGPERIWALFGPADLGPVNFETLKRRTSPNDSLACPQNICIAKSDLASPVFAVSAPELQKAFAKVIASEPSVEQVASDDSGFTRRYVQRTKIMRFPDTIIVRFIDLGDGRSTIALYSRSQLGKSDSGVNIERWLSKLSKEAPAVKTA
jgi:uncharacterized protein (DUF1499 family)